MTPRPAAAPTRSITPIGHLNTVEQGGKTRHKCQHRITFAHLIGKRIEQGAGYIGRVGDDKVKAAASPDPVQQVGLNESHTILDMVSQCISPGDNECCHADIGCCHPDPGQLCGNSNSNGSRTCADIQDRRAPFQFCKAADSLFDQDLRFGPRVKHILVNMKGPGTELPLSQQPADSYPLATFPDQGRVRSALTRCHH